MDEIGLMGWLGVVLMLAALGGIVYLAYLTARGGSGPGSGD